MLPGVSRLGETLELQREAARAAPHVGGRYQRHVTDEIPGERECFLELPRGLQTARQIVLGLGEERLEGDRTSKVGHGRLDVAAVIVSAGPRVNEIAVVGEDRQRRVDVLARLVEALLTEPAI